MNAFYTNRTIHIACTSPIFVPKRKKTSEIETWEDRCTRSLSSTDLYCAIWCTV